MLIIYQAVFASRPDGETAQRWRDYCAKKQLGGLYLVAVQAFETVDPRPLGFDAAVEFPPHKLAEGAPVLNSQMEIVNPNYQGVICDYSYMVESAKKISSFGLYFVQRSLPFMGQRSEEAWKGYDLPEFNPGTVSGMAS